MKLKKRWIKAIVETATKSETKLPWARGAQRQMMIAARKDTPRALRRA